MSNMSHLLSDLEDQSIQDHRSCQESQEVRAAGLRRFHSCQCRPLQRSMGRSGMGGACWLSVLATSARSWSREKIGHKAFETLAVNKFARDLC